MNAIDASSKDERKVAERKSNEDAVMSLDADSDDDKKLKLISNEGEKFELPKKVAIQSELVKTMAEGDKEAVDIPLPNVKASVLRKVVEYMRYHAENPAKEIEKPLKSANMAEVVSPWDSEFVDVDQEVLFELILAANYMDVKPLLDLCCAKVASMIKGKTPEAIRKTFNIVNDFTPEEEAAIIAENKWAESEQ